MTDLKSSVQHYWSNGLCIDESKISTLIVLTVLNQLLVTGLSIAAIKYDVSQVPFEVLQNIQFVLIAGISSINLGAMFGPKK